MSFSNRTPNLGLPQWLASDKPNWDIDTNEAFEKIDDFAGNVNSETASLGGRITNNQDAITSLQNEVQTQSGIITTHGTRISDLETQNQTQQTSINKLNTDVSALLDDMTSVKETNIPAIQQDVSTLQSQVTLNTQNITQIRNTKRYRFMTDLTTNEMTASTLNLSLEEVALLKQCKIVGVELDMGSKSNLYMMVHTGRPDISNMADFDYTAIKNIFDGFLDDFSKTYPSESSIHTSHADKELYADIFKYNFTSSVVTSSQLKRCVLICETLPVPTDEGGTTVYVRGLNLYIKGNESDERLSCNLILEKEGD